MAANGSIGSESSALRERTRSNGVRPTERQQLSAQKVLTVPLREYVNEDKKQDTYLLSALLMSLSRIISPVHLFQDEVFKACISHAPSCCRYGKRPRAQSKS